MNVLISGAGIGGLSAALACLHFGHSVHVLERAPALGEVGAGIQLPPNAMRVFDALGLADRLAARAFRPEALQARMGESGRTLFTVPLGARSEARWGAPYLHIHRADYVDALRKALLARAPEALALGAEVRDYSQTADKVAAHLADGRTLLGDVLIGADGIQSAVRAQMLGSASTDQTSPVFTGNVAWRAVVPMDRLGDLAPDPTACVWMGRGRHAVTYRLRGGKLANFVGVVERDDWREEGWSLRGDAAEALEDFAGWHPVVRRLIERADDGGLHRWALFDRPPLPHWTEGRVALLGDAAHPMLPFMAQGAAMAVEDAYVLARALARPDRPATASLRAYQDARLVRTARAQAASRANMKTFHQRTPAGQLATYGPMWLGGRLAPGAVRARLDWLYGHDVTALPA